jgi:hypothetical protein
MHILTSRPAIKNYSELAVGGNPNTYWEIEAGGS